MNPIQVYSLPAFGDNFIYAAEYAAGKCFVVDPGDAGTVLSFLKKSGLELTDILITHHHMDHTAGVAVLKKRTGGGVIGAQSSADLKVSEGQIVQIADGRIQTIHTPGHTKDGISYYVTKDKDKTPMVFTGDTLFVGGCGRLFECDGQTMWESLNKLAALPEDTRIYCGHDYTVENMEFALSILPNDPACTTFLEKFRSRPESAIPSTIQQEKQINLFLRADTAEVRKALNMLNAPAGQVFAELRKRKDRF